METQEIYILSVELVNFQSHQHSVVPFVKGTNALVGRSNSGKSAVLRGIRWCLRNTPSGAEFIRNGQDDCYVKVNLSNGVSVKRRRTRSGHVNTYELFKNEIATTKDPLTGFGQYVPPEVVEACGMEGFEYLFASQLDPTYLIHETPVARAVKIGGLEELGRIDKALTGTNEDIAANHRRIKDMEREIKELEKQEAALELEVKKRAPRAEALRVLKQSVQANEQLFAKVTSSAKRLHEIENEIKDQERLLQSSCRILSLWKEDLPAKQEMVQRLEFVLRRLITIDQELSSITFMNEDKLNELIALLDQTDRSLIRYQRTHTAAQRLGGIALELKRFTDSYSDKTARLDFTKVDRQIELYKTLSQQSSRLKAIQTEMADSKAQIETSRTAIDQLLDEAVIAFQTAELCPECGQSTTNITCEHVKTFVI